MKFLTLFSLLLFIFAAPTFAQNKFPKTKSACSALDKDKHIKTKWNERTKKCLVTFQRIELMELPAEYYDSKTFLETNKIDSLMKKYSELDSEMSFRNNETRFYNMDYIEKLDTKSKTVLCTRKNEKLISCRDGDYSKIEEASPAKSSTTTTPNNDGSNQ